MNSKQPAKIPISHKISNSNVAVADGKGSVSRNLVGTAIITMNIPSGYSKR